MINHDPRHCNAGLNGTGNRTLGLQLQQCFYAIAVYAKKDSKYTLKVSADGKFTQLSENKLQKGYVEYMDFNMYKFSILSPSGQNQLEAVKFTLSVYSGQVHLYSSRTQLFRAEDIYQHSDKISYQFSYLRFTKEDYTDLSGDYYIYVLGVKSSYYSVIAQVERNTTGSASEIAYQELFYNYMSNVYMLSTEKYYFKVHIYEPDNLYFYIQPIVGQFNVFIANSDSSPPSKSNFIWSNEQSYKGQYVTIQKSDSNLPQNQVIYGVVEAKSPIKSNPFTRRDIQLNFKISYHGSSGIIDIVEDQGYDSYISGSVTHQYRLKVTGQSDYLLSVTPKIQNDYQLRTFIFRRQGSKYLYPSEQENDGNYSGQVIIPVNYEQMKKHCGSSGMLGNLVSDSCYVHVTIQIDRKDSSVPEPNQNTSMFYTLMAESNKPKQLSDGLAVSSQIPNHTQFKHYYYFVQTNQSISIFVKSYYHKLHILASLRRFSDEDESLKVYDTAIYPDLANYAFIASPNHTFAYNSLLIPH